MAGDQSPGGAPQAKPSVRTGQQIKALLKKNVKIHMRTSAIPCCTCTCCNVCLLHFLCPILFVMCATFVPWAIVKFALSESDANLFLNVEIQPPTVFKRWPGFDQVNGSYRMTDGGYGHDVRIDSENPGRNLVVDPAWYPGAINAGYNLWAPKAWRTYDWFSAMCAAELRGCHCKTLALVGPDNAVAQFKAFLQQEVDDFWSKESETRAAFRESMAAFARPLRIANAHPLRRLSPVDEAQEGGIFGSDAGAPDTILRRMEAARQDLRDMAAAVQGDIVDFLDPAIGLRRLQSNSSNASQRAFQRARGRAAAAECEERTDPVAASEYCDVEPGHNGTIFRSFASLAELDRFVDAMEYGRYPRDRSETSTWDRLCGAVILENDVLTAAVPAYSIRLNVTEKGFKAEDITNRKNTPVEHGNGANKWYSATGFLSLQHYMHKFLAARRSGGAAAPTPDLLQGDPHVVPIATQEERSWAFGDVVGGFLGNPLVMGMMFGPIVASIAFYIARERATRQRELMRMMGLSDGSLLWSWVIMFVAFNFFITLVMTIFFMAFFFIQSNFFLIWMALFWFSNASVSFGMFVASFVTSDRNASMHAVGLFIGTSFIQSAVDNAPAGAKALIALFPANGFFMTMGTVWSWETAGLGATFSTSNSMRDDFSVGLGIWMLFVGFWFWILVYYYIDNVAFWHGVSIPRKPWFCFTGAYWKEVMGKPPTVEDDGGAAMEAGGGNASANPKYIEPEEDVHLKEMVQNDRCVIIRSLCKSFLNAAREKVLAVKDLSLTMYQDECFCLLGHNGAGKTTTMLMLTGCLPQTSGQIKVKGHKVPEQIRSIRTSMGFCPQHNVLFNELTVFEHLELFGTLGGMTPENIKQRGAELVAAVALTDKMNTNGASLSGGMKRKLSAALAFLSEPYLVILDEPSSGMDPFARRGMWNTLKQWRTGHILCLTTHYMDEADALGDRIAIMSSGQLACKGSSTFLKRQFGCGYVISFAKVDDVSGRDSKILAAVREVLGGDAEVMSAVGKELLVQVPFAAANKFSILFPQLDRIKDELGIESYGTSITNLEEVFLKVAKMEKQEKLERQQSGDGGGQAEASTWASPDAQAGVKQASFGLQVSALLIRRMKFGIRNRMTCACQIGLPIFCLYMYCMIASMSAVTALKPLILGTSNWNLEVQTGPRVPITVGAMQSSSTAFRDEVQATWNGVPGIDSVQYSALSPASYAVTPPSTASSVLAGVAEESAFAQAMLANERLHAASQYGGVFYPQRSSWCPASQPSVCPDLGVTAMVNLTAPHAGPVLLNAHAAAVLRRRSTGITDIQVTNHPFQLVEKQVSRMNFISGIFASIIIMAAYGFVPSGVTAYCVMEKEKDVKNQLIISGCSYSAYWLSNFLFDVFWGLIPAIGAWIIFAIFGLSSFTDSPGIDGSVALFLTFLPAMAGQAYLFSFLFSKSGVALFFSWIFNLSVGMIATITISILRNIRDAYGAYKALQWIFRFVPIFSLGYGHLMISVFQRGAKERNVGALAGIGVGGGACEDPANVVGEYRDEERCTFMVGDEFMMLVISGFLYMGLTICIDIVFGLPIFKRICGCGSGPGLSGKVIDSCEDEMVQEEKRRVNEVNRSSQFVFVQDVHKVYKRGFHAVRGISFAASEGQVFGLLGVNGAGKTTTFKMLCGQVEPTAGQVWIQGHDVTTQTGEARRLIGYCPQFDALLDSLTTREHLYLYGRLKGLKGGELHSAVTQGFSDLDLEQYVKSRAGQLSGGNKRKLSVAMATIGEPPMVFLDEPSAGMDPVARRGMWSVIQNIADKRKRSVVILTTHSMEEAEALCSRIAIQVDGQFRCLGTPQQIKSRYGQGLELNVRLATPTPAEIAECCTKLGGVGSQFIEASVVASRLEAAFGDSVLSEVRSRPGSPLAPSANGGFVAAQVLLALVAEWAILASRTKALETFMVDNFKPEANGQPAIMALEKAQNVLRYQVLSAALQGRFKSLGTLFQLFQENQSRLNLEDFQVCQTSLEQVFNKFATSQASQAGSQPPAQPPAQAGPAEPAQPAAPPQLAAEENSAVPEPEKPSPPLPPAAVAPTTVVADTSRSPPGTPENK